MFSFTKKILAQLYTRHSSIDNLPKKPKSILKTAPGNKKPSKKHVSFGTSVVMEWDGNSTQVEEISLNDSSSDEGICITVPSDDGNVKSVQPKTRAEEKEALDDLKETSFKCRAFCMIFIFVVLAFVSLVRVVTVESLIKNNGE